MEESSTAITGTPSVTTVTTRTSTETLKTTARPPTPTSTAITTGPPPPTTAKTTDPPPPTTDGSTDPPPSTTAKTTDPPPPTTAKTTTIQETTALEVTSSLSPASRRTTVHTLTPTTPRNTTNSTVGTLPTSGPVSNDTSAIIGGAIGGVVVILLILVAVFIVKRRRRRAAEEEAKHGSTIVRHYDQMDLNASADRSTYINQTYSPEEETTPIYANMSTFGEALYGIAVDAALPVYSNLPMPNNQGEGSVDPHRKLETESDFPPASAEEMTRPSLVNSENATESNRSSHLYANVPHSGKETLGQSELHGGTLEDPQYMNYNPRSRTQRDTSSGIYETPVVTKRVVNS